MIRFMHWFNNLYSLWLVTLAVISSLKPLTMLWFDNPWVFWSLAASRLVGTNPTRVAEMD